MRFLVRFFYVKKINNEIHVQNVCIMFFVLKISLNFCIFHIVVDHANFFDISPDSYRCRYYFIVVLLLYISIVFPRWKNERSENFSDEAKVIIQFLIRPEKLDVLCIPRWKIVRHALLLLFVPVAGTSFIVMSSSETYRNNSIRNSLFLTFDKRRENFNVYEK